MKASYYLGGLALGLIIGGGIGYMVATDPKKRRKINRMLTEINEKVTDISDKVKATVGNLYDEALTDEEIMEIETALATEAIADAEVKAAEEIKKKAEK